MPKGIPVSVYIDIELYGRVRELLTKQGYRSFSQLVNELLSNWLKSVEGESGEETQGESNSYDSELYNNYNNSNITDITDSYNSYNREEESGRKRIPESPCKSCEYLRGSICAKYDKPITRCTECPEMRRYMLAHFRVE